MVVELSLICFVGKLNCFELSLCSKIIALNTLAFKSNEVVQVVCQWMDMLWQLLVNLYYFVARSHESLVLNGFLLR